MFVRPSLCHLATDSTHIDPVRAPLIGGGIKRCFCLTSICLSVAYIKSKSRTERPRKTKIGTEITYVICDSDTTFKVKRSKVKGLGHQDALLSAALTRKAAAAVSVATYSAWESTATLRLLGGARGAWAPTGGQGRGTLCRDEHSLLLLFIVMEIFLVVVV